MNSIMNKLRRFIIGAVSVLAISTIAIGANNVAAAAPTASVVSPNSGTYFTLSNVSIIPDAVDAFVTGYTTDGTTPMFSCASSVCSPLGTTQEYLAPFALNGSDGSTVTLWANSYDVNGIPGIPTSRIYTFDRTAPVIVGTLNGEFHNNNVTLSITEPHVKEIYVNGVLVPTLLPFTTDGNYIVRVVDEALNEASISFVIDKTSPVLQLNGANPLTIEVKTPFNDLGVRVIEANNLVTTWTTGNLNTGVVGSYVVTYFAQDEAGNIGQVSRVVNVVDTTVPVISGVNDGAYYNAANTPRTIVFTDTNTPTATLNGLPFASGETITEEGNYVLVVSDLGSNTITIDFVIDKTVPEYLLTGIGNGDFYRSNVSVNFSDANLDYATLNGTVITNGYVATTEGFNTLVVYDKAGNTVSKSFTIDKTVPQALATGTEGQTSYYRSNVTLNFSDLNLFSAVLDGNAVVNGVVVTIEGAHRLVVTDLAGNVTTLFFTVDKTAPLVLYEKNSWVYVLPSGTYWNVNVFLKYMEDYPYISSINGTQINLDITPVVLTADGVYVIYFEDMAGNTTTITVTIDKTVPQALATGTEGQTSYYRSNVTLNFSDLNLLSAVLDGSAVADGVVVTTEGMHTLVVTDRAGNVTTLVFTIDKTVPQALATGTEGQTSYYRSNATLNFSDLNLFSAVLDGNAVIDGVVVTTEGVHTLVVTDMAGNVTTLVFTIDMTKPWVAGVTDGTYYPGSVVIGFGDVNFFTASLNGNAVNPGDTISGDGNYILVVVDRAGNITVVNFTIDTVDPVVANITQGGYYNRDVLITFSDSNLDFATLNGVIVNSGDIATLEDNYTLVVYDQAGNTIVVNFTIDKTTPAVLGVTNGSYYNNARTITFSDLHLAGATLNGNQFTSGSVVAGEGVYALDVYDLAGNHTTILFTVDITPPIYTGVVNDGYYNHAVSVVLTDLYAVTATLNGSPYTSGNMIEVAGDYHLVITDAAGNVTTVNFVIDYLAPVVGGVLDGAYYNADRLITFSDTYISGATLNGNVFVSGTTVSAEGAYALVVTDLAGNTTTITFVIDKTVPAVLGVTNGSYYNNNRIITFGDNSPVAATLNGSLFTSGSTVSTPDNYVLVVADAAGNVTTISFVIDKTKPIITLIGDNQFVLEVGSEYKEPGFTAFDDVDGDITANVIIIGVVDNMFLGLNIITYQVTDRAGNVTTFTRLVKVVDTTKPVITLNGGSSLTYLVGETFLEKGATANDNFDGDITNKIMINGVVDTSREGTYTVTYTVTDANGNTAAIVRTITVLAKAVAPVAAVFYNPTFPVAEVFESNGEVLGSTEIADTPPTETQEIYGEDFAEVEKTGLPRLLQNIDDSKENLKEWLKSNKIAWIIILVILVAAGAGLYFYMAGKRLEAEDLNQS